MLLLRIGIICYGDNVQQKVRESLALLQSVMHIHLEYLNRTEIPRPVHFPTCFPYFVLQREVFQWLTETTI